MRWSDLKFTSWATQALSNLPGNAGSMAHSSMASEGRRIDGILYNLPYSEFSAGTAIRKTENGTVLMNFCKPCGPQWFNLDSSDLLITRLTTIIFTTSWIFVAIWRLYIKCLQEFFSDSDKPCRHVEFTDKFAAKMAFRKSLLEPQSISNFSNWRFSWIGPFNCIIAILSIVPFQMSLFEELKTWRSTWKCGCVYHPRRNGADSVSHFSLKMEQPGIINPMWACELRHTNGDQQVGSIFQQFGWRV